LISVILPTYKEEQNIGFLVDKLKQVLYGEDYEILVVDDDSPDMTSYEAVSRGAKVITRKARKGNLFESIKLGVKNAKGDYIVMMDADLSHPPEKITEMLEYKEYDVVSCSRYMHGGKMIAPTFITRNASKVMNYLLKMILGLGYSDITGGFHLMKKSTFNKLGFRYPADWGEFDLELFYRAKEQGLLIKEVPFVYIARKYGQSKTRSLKYAIKYLVRAVELRLR